VPVTRRLRQVGAGDLSLNAPAQVHQERPLAETLADESVVQPDETLARAQDREWLGSLLQTLPAREQQVLALRHGLDGSAPRTLAETGQALGLHRQRVHQLETAALKKLRARANQAS
jgi:RNA polymerase primary sigma factor